MRAGSLLFLVVVFNAAVVSTAATTTSGPASAPAELSSLVRQLSADQWNLRQQAHDKIVAMGAEARPLVEELAQKTSDPQLKSELDAILDQMASLDKTGPTLITMDLNKASVDDAVNEIERQAKCEITIWPPGTHHQGMKNVTIHASRKPLLEVIEDLCMQADLTPQNMGMNRPFVLMWQQRAGQWSRPSVRSGPYMIFADTIQATQTSNLGMKATSDQIELSLNVIVEPKVLALGRATNADITEALDDLNQSWATGNQPEAVQHGGGGTEHVFQLNAPLKRPKGFGGTLKVVKGSVRFLVPVKSDVLEVSDITKAKNVTKKVGDATFVVTTNTQQNNRVFTMDVDISCDPADQRDYNPYPYQNARLVDKDGKAYGPPSGGGGGGNGHYHYSLYFDRDPDGMQQRVMGTPEKLVWEIPSEIKEIAVPFEFKDLPLPPVPQR